MPAIIVYWNCLVYVQMGLPPLQGFLQTVSEIRIFRITSELRHERAGLQNISYAGHILIGQRTPQNFASRNVDKK